MSRYQDAFATIADRGTPAGATALLERVEAETSISVQTLAVPRRSRMSAVAVAAIAFIAVLAGGLTWGFLVKPGTDVTEGSGIEWTELVGANFGFESVVAGPGGFVRSAWLGRPGDSGVEFSVDGKTWAQVELPADGASFGFGRAQSTDNRWLFTSYGGDANEIWMSIDGMTWSPVAGPAGFEDTMVEITASRNGFFAMSIDVFEEDAITMWWSTDGTDWAQIQGPPGEDPTGANLRGTSGGLAWLPFDSAGPTATIYHTIDGTGWVEGSLQVPADLVEPSVRLRMGKVAFLADRWIALGQIQRASAPPVLHAWTSDDGIDWTPRGVVDFGAAGDRAVDAQVAAVLGDRFVVAPDTVPVARNDEGILTGQGEVISTGEVWSSADGETWIREFRTDGEITSLAGRMTDDGKLVGLWIRKPVSADSEPVVATTAAPVPPQELDPAGLELQAEILADGKVTREEYEQALEGWKDCMESHGMVDVSFEIEPSGYARRGFGSPDGFTGEAEEAACDASYVRQVQDALHP